MGHFLNYNDIQQCQELEYTYSSIWVNIQIQLSFRNNWRHAKHSGHCLWFLVRNIISRVPVPRPPPLIILRSGSVVTRTQMAIVSSFCQIRSYLPSGTHIGNLLIFEFFSTSVIISGILGYQQVRLLYFVQFVFKMKLILISYSFKNKVHVSLLILLNLIFIFPILL